MSLFRSIIAIAVGYAVVAVGTATIFYLVPNNGSFTKSGPGELVLDGLLVLICAIVAAHITASIAKRKPGLHGLIIVLLIALETLWIITTKRSAEPVWFDVLGGLNMIFGLLIGSQLYKLRHEKSQDQ